MDLDKCCSDGSSTIFIPLMVSTGGERMVMLKTQVSPGPLNSGLNSSCVDSVILIMVGLLFSRMNFVFLPLLWLIYLQCIKVYVSMRV